MQKKAFFIIDKFKNYCKCFFCTVYIIVNLQRLVHLHVYILASILTGDTRDSLSVSGPTQETLDDGTCTRLNAALLPDFILHTPGNVSKSRRGIVG